jgi:hypothetical protein
VAIVCIAAAQDSPSVLFASAVSWAQAFVVSPLASERR